MANRDILRGSDLLAEVAGVARRLSAFYLRKDDLERAEAWAEVVQSLERRTDPDDEQRDQSLGGLLGIGLKMIANAISEGDWDRGVAWAEIVWRLSGTTPDASGRHRGGGPPV